jgi:predicted acyl esterase
MVRIMIDKTPMMPMRGGVRLATDLLRLDDAPPAPVLLILPIIER